MSTAEQTLLSRLVKKKGTKLVSKEYDRDIDFKKWSRLDTSGLYLVQ